MTKRRQLPFADKSTNAHVLNDGDRLTYRQIEALAILEDWYIEGGNRDEYARDVVEGVCHAFMCNALGECVCSTPRELEV